VAKTMNLAAPIVIIIRLRLNEGIEGIYYLAIPNYNYANGTDAAPLIIGCLKVYCCKVFHISNLQFAPL
jgi:hypothetical protein